MRPNIAVEARKSSLASGKPVFSNIDIISDMALSAPGEPGNRGKLKAFTTPSASAGLNCCIVGSSPNWQSILNLEQ
ncbi:MAG: hypothetical protein Q6370_015565 [Candidatus Sigynarchaeota archaeon]